MSVQDHPFTDDWRDSPGHASRGSIRVGGSANGFMTYLVDLPPEALPSACKRDRFSTD